MTVQERHVAETNPLIGWLGKVPEGWAVEPGKRIFKQTRAASLPHDEQLSATQKYGVVPQRMFMETEGQKVVLALSGTENFKHVDADDFVISLRSFQGGVERCFYSGCVSPAYTVLKGNAEVNPSFFGYVLKSTPYISALQTVTDGIREGKSISYEQFGLVPLPLPPMTEQIRIANFLDEQTAWIDALIAEKERLQGALEEWRIAELERICFGTNTSSVRTGNVWIPFLPEGWRLARLKHLVSGIEQGWSPECEARPAEGDEWGVLKAGASNGGVFRDREHKALPATLEPVPELEVKPGNVLVSRASGSADLVGSFAYVYVTRPRLMLSDKNFRLKFPQKPSLLPELLAWMCNTYSLRQQVRQFVSGAEGLAKNIGSGNLRELWLAVPPEELQPEIVTSLRELKQRLDQMEAHLVDHIARLREYRASLISAAVTGQLDITKYQGTC